MSGHNPSICEFCRVPKANPIGPCETCDRSPSREWLDTHCAYLLERMNAFVKDSSAKFPNRKVQQP